MRAPGPIAVAAQALALSGCIWEEPINSQPPAQDSAVTIQSVVPTTHQAEVLYENGQCVVKITGVTAYSPQSDALYAELWLNYEEADQIPAAQIISGQQSPTSLVAQGGSLYALANSIPVVLSAYPASLNSTNGSTLANVLTLFVSDGFPPDGPLQPQGSAHSTDQWSWQLWTQAEPCISLIGSAAPSAP